MRSRDQMGSWGLLGPARTHCRLQGRREHPSSPQDCHVARAWRVGCAESGVDEPLPGDAWHWSAHGASVSLPRPACPPHPTFSDGKFPGQQQHKRRGKNRPGQKQAGGHGQGLTAPLDSPEAWVPSFADLTSGTFSSGRVFLGDHSPAWCGHGKVLVCLLDRAPTP